MEKFTTSSFRLGIVGGGQLGRMLAAKAAQWDVHTSCLDKDEKAPARVVCDGFQLGSMTSYDDVLAFGKTVDMITIESDNVNADALEELVSLGKKVFPNPAALRKIQDKGLQRLFCQENKIPSPRFEVVETKEALKQSLSQKNWDLPVIVKTRKAGYDGKGVFTIAKLEEIEHLPDVGFVIEEKVDLAKELTVLCARNQKGEVRTYPTIELFMRPSAYLVDYLISPAELSESIHQQAQEIGTNLIEAFQIEGLLAVELFLDQKGNLTVNECSPRPHNSGHQTIEGSFTSQYEQHLRAIFNLPLGSCEAKIPTAMINLLGEPDADGEVIYQGLEECLAMEGVQVHIYGKQFVKPYRKMGHITVMNQSYEKLNKMVKEIKERVKVTA